MLWAPMAPVLFTCGQGVSNGAGREWVRVDRPCRSGNNGSRPTLLSRSTTRKASVERWPSQGLTAVSVERMEWALLDPKTVAGRLFRHVSIQRRPDTAGIQSGWWRRQNGKTLRRSCTAHFTLPLHCSERDRGAAHLKGGVGVLSFFDACGTPSRLVERRERE